jgi:hypothetical protein
VLVKVHIAGFGEGASCRVLVKVHIAVC